MKKAAFCALLAVMDVVVFGVSIGAVYAFVLPRLFPEPGWATALPLIVGIITATLIGGYIGYRASVSDRSRDKIGLGFFYAVVVAGLVSYLSLFIILNTRGS